MMKRMVLLIVILSAACSEGTVGEEVASLQSTTTIAPATAGEPAENVTEDQAEEALLAFTQCLREEGIEIDDPTMSGDGNLGLGIEIGGSEADFAAFEAANEKCSEHLEGIVSEFNPADDTEFQDQLLAFAECMRDRGIEMDDPDFSGGPEGAEGGIVLPFGEVNPNDPAFEEAFEACNEYLSEFAPPQP